MFRKLVLASAAAAAIAVTALTPTTASAGWGVYVGYRPFYAYRHYAPVYVAPYGCIKWVRGYYGWRRINVCY